MHMSQTHIVCNFMYLIGKHITTEITNPVALMKIAVHNHIDVYVEYVYLNVSKWFNMDFGNIDKLAQTSKRVAVLESENQQRK